MRDFTKYEYADLLNKMTNLLKDKEGWGDGYQSSMGQTLIQLVTDVTDNLHYMLERRTNENFIETASLRSSVISRANELGYRPRRAIGNRGLVKVMTPNPVSSDYVIERFSLFKFGDMTFYATQDAVIKQGESETTVSVVLGRLVENDYSVVNNQVVISDYDYIDNNCIHVVGGGIEYKDVMKMNDVNKRALLFLTGDDAAFDIKYSVSGMNIVFGDGEFGKAPPETVRISYIDVFENTTSIHSIGNEFTFDLDSEIICENVSEIVGYRLPESLQSIKINAPVYHRTNGRAVTNEDYAYWVKNAGLPIVDAYAYGEEEISTTLFNLNNVYVNYLKNDGGVLTLEERQKLRSFIDTVKTSQAHVVFTPVEMFKLSCKIDVRKYPSLPISDAEVYQRVYDFITKYFKLTEGSIGKGVQSSDVVRDLYRETVTRDGVTYPLIDFCKVDFDGVVDFTYPPKTFKSFVNLGVNYPPSEGDEFVLVLENLVCMIEVEDGDDQTAILTKMRDKIRQETPFNARIVVSGVVLDVNGNPLPVEVDTTIGSILLIGRDTPFYNNRDIIHPPVIGSSLAKVVLGASAINIHHNYYSSRAGRRPMIPLRVGTRIVYRAPNDTDVRVYTRINKDDPDTEVLLTTIDAGMLFDQTFTDIHTLQFEFVNDSDEDTVANIVAPYYDGTAFGLEIDSPNRVTPFTIQTTSGDLSSFVTVDYSIRMPNYLENAQVNSQRILNKSLRVIDKNTGEVVISDRGNGYLNDENGQIISTGNVNYINGELTLPLNFPDGEYRILFDQDVYDNFDAGVDVALSLITPNPSINDTTENLSTIRVV
jgi:hypothetical protein